MGSSKIASDSIGEQSERIACNVETFHADNDADYKQRNHLSNSSKSSTNITSTTMSHYSTLDRKQPRSFNPTTLSSTQSLPEHVSSIPKQSSSSSSSSFYNSPPSTAAEYLRRVRQEANACPNVVQRSPDVCAAFARGQKQQLLQRHASKSRKDRRELIQNSFKCQYSPPQRLPTSDWRCAFGARLAEIRQSFVRTLHYIEPKHNAASSLPAKTSTSSETNIHTKLDDDDDDDDESDNVLRQDMSSSPLSMCSLSIANAAQRLPHARDSSGWTRLLRSRQRFPLVSELCVIDEITTSQALRHAYTVVKQDNNLHEITALWIYALLIRIDKPLPADTSSCLRAFYRLLAAIRSDAVYDNDIVIPLINILLSIIDMAFGQGVDMLQANTPALKCEQTTTHTASTATTINETLPMMMIKPKIQSEASSEVSYTLTRILQRVFNQSL